MDTRSDSKQGFRLGAAALGGIAGAIAGYLLTGEWPDVLVGAGVGFVLSGAVSLLGPIWKYLAVFFALTGGFVWLVAHYVK
jgi:uncharacterized membrane protein YjjP (DUF1212 family)